MAEDIKFNIIQAAEDMPLIEEGNKDDGEPDLDESTSKRPKGKIIVSKHKKRYYMQNFRSSWLSNPVFKGWLEELEGISNRAWCSYCQCEVQTKFHDLKKHAETKKHLKHAADPTGVKIKPRPRPSTTMHSEVESIVVNLGGVSSTKGTPVNHVLHSRIFNDTLRLWQCCGTEILPHNLMYPIFITDNPDGIQPMPSLPGIFRYGVNKICAYLNPLINDGLSAVLLHCVPSRLVKDNSGSSATTSHNPILSAIKKLKEFFPALVIACDVCLCPFTDHGHCGMLNPEDGTINPEASIRRLTEISMAYAAAGANIIAPSDMMDGRIGAIKSNLQQASLGNRVAVLSYAAKFASALNGEFREMNHPVFEVGENVENVIDKRSYQLPPGSMGMALKSVERDVAEGADMLLVQPALPYLDVIREIKDRYPTHSVFAYQVSGEYGMLHHASCADSFDLQSTLQEILISMRRAGADVIITYYAPLILQWLKQQM